MASKASLLAMIRDIAEISYERGMAANQERDDFSAGMAAAYHDILSNLSEYSELREVSLESIGLEGLDIDGDLLIPPSKVGDK